MKVVILLFFHCFIVFTHGHAIPSEHKIRRKREVAGALDIVTNHGQAIHEDVKPEVGEEAKVTPPQDAIFEGKSLRKSSPLIGKFELIRSINRVVTLAVLIITAVIEFYPMIRYLFNIIAFILV